jgi:hypothetical protein
MNEVMGQILAFGMGPAQTLERETTMNEVMSSILTFVMILNLNSIKKAHHE